MKVQETCMGCQKTFWAKAKKNKTTGKTESLDNLCQTCKNKIRQRGQKRAVVIRAFPKTMTERDHLRRDLIIVEMERRRKERESKGPEPTARIPG